MLSFGLIAKKDVNAAGKSANLPINKICTQYDITGDHKKDSIKIKANYDPEWEGIYYKTITIYINNKAAYQYKAGSLSISDIYANIITLKNGKQYLFINYMSEWEYGKSYLLTYSNGSLKQVMFLQQYLNIHKTSNYGAVFMVTLKSVKDNTFTTTYYYRGYSTGAVNFNITFKYKSGSFVQTSNIHAINCISANEVMVKSRNLTAKKAIQTYTKAGGTKKSFKLKKGDKAKPTHIYLKKNAVYIKLSRNSKTGYIKAATKMSACPFSNCYYE